MSDRIAELRADRDAPGHMLLDHLKGERADEIVEREDGFIVAGDAGRYFAGYSAWRSEEQEAMRWLVPGRALDPQRRRNGP